MNWIDPSGEALNNKGRKTFVCIWTGFQLICGNYNPDNVDDRTGNPETNQPASPLGSPAGQDCEEAKKNKDEQNPEPPPPDSYPNPKFQSPQPNGNWKWVLVLIGGVLRWVWVFIPAA